MAEKRVITNLSNRRESADDPFVVELSIRFEVDKDTESIPSGFQIVMDLCAVLIGELGNGFNS